MNEYESGEILPAIPPVGEAVPDAVRNKAAKLKQKKNPTEDEKQWLKDYGARSEEQALSKTVMAEEQITRRYAETVVAPDSYAAFFRAIEPLLEGSPVKAALNVVLQMVEHQSRAERNLRLGYIGLGREKERWIQYLTEQLQQRDREALKNYELREQLVLKEVALEQSKTEVDALREKAESGGLENLVGANLVKAAMKAVGDSVAQKLQKGGFIPSDEEIAAAADKEGKHD